MKIFLLITIVVLSCSVNGQRYTNKYDNVDLQQILRSERLLRSYVNCLLDRGRCTPDGAELKKAVPDALHNQCSRCTERQRNGATAVLRYLIENRRDLWSQLEQKYDPQGLYRRKYEEEARREGIVL